MHLLVISNQLVTILAFLAVVLLIISFCLSGAEVAFFSLSFKDINYIKTKTRPNYKRILQLLENPKQLQGSLSVANITVNLGLIVLLSTLFDQFLFLENWWLVFLIKVVAISIIVILFGEILPKVFAAQNNLRFARDIGFLVEFVYLLFNKVANATVNTSEAIDKKFRNKRSASNIEELNNAIDEGEGGDATEEEKNILKGIIGFGNITVKQVMRARLDVHGLPYNFSFTEVKNEVKELHYSRFPVYDASLDEIKGIIHTKDLLADLRKADDFDWHVRIRPAFFVHEQKPIEDLMNEFQKNRIHFAIVADEFGGTSGIVTMEDILEEVIGEITDEFDDEVSGNQKIDDLNYIFEGKTMLNDVCKQMKLDHETFDAVKGESDSLAGLLLEVSGEIPVANTVINIGDFNFKVLEVTRNRIETVQVTINVSE